MDLVGRTRRGNVSDIQQLIDSVREELSPHLGEGQVADYIPKLANVDPRKLGICVTTLDGETFSSGDAEEPFSIQSISKVFSVTLAGRIGDWLWKRVGREGARRRCHRGCRRTACGASATRGDWRDSTFRAVSR